MSDLELPLLSILPKELDLSKTLILQDAIDVTTEKYFSYKSPEDVKTNIDQVKEMMTTIEKYVDESISTKFELPFRINAFTLTKNSKDLVYGTTKGNIVIFNTQKKVIKNDVPVSNDSIFSILATKDEKYLLACGKGNTIRVYNYPSLTYKLEIEGHTDNVMRLIQTKDGKSLFSISEDQTVRRWDLTNFTGGEILYRHEGKIKSIVLSHDENLLFTGGEDKVIRMYDFRTQTEVAQLPGHTAMIWALAVSADGKLLASGATDILIWDLATLQVIKTLEGHTKRVSSLQFSPDWQYLVSASTDTTIAIWPLYNKASHRILSGHTGWVKAMMISPDQKCIYSGGEDSTFRIWAFPRDIEDISVTEVSQKVNRLDISCDGRYLITSNETTIKIVDINNNYSSSELDFDMLPTQKSIIYKNASSVIIPTNLSVSIYDILTEETHQSPELHTNSITCVAMSASGNLLLTGGKDSKIGIWELPSFKQSYILRGHQNEITALGITFDGTKLISADTDYKIRVWNIAEKTTLAILTEHQNNVYHILTNKSSMLITGDESGVINIWDLNDYLVESTFNVSAAVTGLYLSVCERELIASDANGKFYFWEVTTRQLITTISLGHPVDSFCVDPTEMKIYYNNQQTVLHMKNPLKTREFSIYGEGNKDPFIEYLNSIMIDKRVTAHLPEFDNWLIMPYRINVSHIFAYYGKVDLIRSFYKNNFNILRSTTVETPLSISIYRGLTDITDIILDTLIQEIPSNKFLLSSIDDCLVLLNYEGNKFLPTLYESFMRVVDDERLPKFCDGKYVFPLIKLSEGMRLDSDTFIPTETQSFEGELIVFKESLIKINCSAGSKWSLDFLDSILECPNQDIFRSDYIKALLSHKWSQLKYYMHVQAFVFLFYLGLLCLLTLSGFENWVMICIAFVLNMVLLMFEVFQIVVTGKQYWSDVWNFLDIVRSTAFMVFLLFKMLNVAEGWNYEILSLVTLTSWVRGIAYFRIFTNTRYIIKLLTEVLKDMKAFLAILLYSTMSFSFLFLVIKDSPTNPVVEHKFMNYLEGAYGLNLGEMQQDYNNDLYQFSILTIALIINPIVMLNLLISIIGDTFDRVQSEMIIADMKELCEMIIEIENLLYWRRSAGMKTYLQICTTKQSEEIDNQWEGKLRVMEKKLNDLSQNLYTIDKKNTARFDNLDRSIGMLAKEFRDQSQNGQ